MLSFVQIVKLLVFNLRPRLRLGSDYVIKELRRAEDRMTLDL